MSNKAIEDKSDKILAGISDKAMKAEIKSSLDKLKKSALKDKFGSLPIKRPKETEVSYRDRIKNSIGNFMRRFTVTPEAASKKSVTGLKKGGLVKKKMNKGGMPKKNHAKPGSYSKAYMKGGMAKKKK